MRILTHAAKDSRESGIPHTIYKDVNYDPHYVKRNPAMRQQLSAAHGVNHTYILVSALLNMVSDESYKSIRNISLILRGKASRSAPEFRTNNCAVLTLK